MKELHGSDNQPFLDYARTLERELHEALEVGRTSLATSQRHLHDAAYERNAALDRAFKAEAACAQLRYDLDISFHASLISEVEKCELERLRTDKSRVSV